MCSHENIIIKKETKIYLRFVVANEISVEKSQFCCEIIKKKYSEKHVVGRRRIAASFTRCGVECGAKT
jgi:hypothetical protein